MVGLLMWSRTYLILFNKYCIICVMEDLQKIKDLILVMVKSIVSKPDEVEIHSSEETGYKGEYTQINIKCAEKDVHIAIGSEGTTAESVRRIALLYAVQLNYTRSIAIRVDAPILPSNYFYKKEE